MIGLRSVLYPGPSWGFRGRNKEFGGIGKVSVSGRGEYFISEDNNKGTMDEYVRKGLLK